VAVLIFTNLMLLPIILSYIGVSPKAAARSLKVERDMQACGVRPPIWAFLDKLY
jgi:hypothetical protein